MRFLTVIFTLLLIGFQSNFAQDVRDVEVATSKDKIVVTYDLFGKKNKDYQIDLLFKKADGSEIRPKALSGDIGKKVRSGESKTIVWDLYKDIDELTGAIEPILKVSEPIEKPKTQTQKVSNQAFKRHKNRKVKGMYKIGWGKSDVISNQNQLSYDNKKGFETGLGLRWNIAKGLYLQPEALYRKHAYKQSIQGPQAGTILHNEKLHYAKSQLIVGISPFKGGLYFNGGPYASYMFSAKRKIQSNGNSVTVNIQDLENRYNEIDYGYSLGASLDLGKGAAVFGFLYTEGLNNTINNSAYTAESADRTLDLKNRSYNFYVTFGF